jgi:hypothetical protein
MTVPVRGHDLPHKSKKPSSGGAGGSGFKKRR